MNNAEKQSETIDWERLEIYSRKLARCSVEMGMIKDRNDQDLPEAEEIEKRWQEYTEELYKKGLNCLDNHDSVVIHLEPDILECEISGLQEALLQAELVEMMEFQLSYLKS